MPDTRRVACCKPSEVRGALALVVGPSGAGKDALINGARDCLGDSGPYYFARRVITRDRTPASSEQHTPVRKSEFDQAQAAGEYFLHWQAHGTKYAIPSRALEELRSGRVVVANVSRTILTDALRHDDDATIIQVTASASVRAERLANRGRETAADVADRLSRSVSIECLGARIVTIDNSGSLEFGTEAMVSALRDIASRRRAASGERS